MTVRVAFLLCWSGRGYHVPIISPAASYAMLCYAILSQRKRHLPEMQEKCSRLIMQDAENGIQVGV